MLNGRHNNSMDVRAKQRLCYERRSFPQCCVKAVSPHVISTVICFLARQNVFDYVVNCESMKRFINIAIFIFTFVIGIVSTQVNGIVNIETKQVAMQEIQTVIAPEKTVPRFQLLRRDFNGFEFLSSGGELQFDNGANISILHNFINSEGMREIFTANCMKKRKGQSIERSFEPDESGRKILRRCVIVERDGKTRIIWNESNTEYWTIDATSLSLAKEFENSDAFSLVKYWDSSKRY